MVTATGRTPRRRVISAVSAVPKRDAECRAPRPSPEELLRAVDLWLVNRAGRMSRALGLSHEDLLQEFRVRVFRLAGGYDPARGKPTTWATTVIRSAINAVVSERRRSVKAWGEASGAPDAVDLGVGDIPDGRFPQPDEAAEAHDQAAAVRALLAGLDPLQARAVALRFGIGEPGEVTGEELGRRLGVCRAAAFELVRAGLEALRGRAAGLAG